LNMDGYPRTPPASFDPDPTTSWDISPITPFDSGAFQNINSPDGTWSPWFGHGKVDAEAAVAEALRLRQAPEIGATIRQSSAPARAIPDNNATGITDTINIAAAAAIGTLKITLDITHTFIGDLRATLTAPSGTSVVLHNRSGGNADNLQRSFDTASTPGLSVLLGQAVQGDWQLLVQDLAAVDTGRLNRWEMEIVPSANATVTFSETPGISIPDNNPTGIERQLTTNATGTVNELEVTVDITHTFIGDLNVTLHTPAGTSVALHQRTGGNTDNLIQRYTFTNTPALQTLRGQPIQGTWRLRVADLEAQDAGKLNQWGVKITRQT
jgi:subtilisin-like proprotein convertase family protein